MSLILDALNKAQRERQEQHEPVPQLSTVHYTPPEEAAPRRNLLWLGVGGAAAIALASFAAGLWITRDAPPSPMAVQAPAQAAPAPASSAAVGQEFDAALRAPEPRPVREAAIAEPARVTEPASQANVRPEVSGLYESANAPAPVPAAKPAATEAQTAKLSADVMPAPQAQSAASASNAPQTLPATAPSATQAPAPSAMDTLTTDTLASRIDVPYVQQMSWNVQQNLPTLNYSRHEYSASPANRRVEINGKYYRAGSKIAEGLTVDEVLQDGVILRYQNRPFKLEALNSWVNF